MIARASLREQAMAATFTNLLYHIIFSTQGRQPLIPTEQAEEIHHYIGGIVREEGGALLEAGGMPDHIHLVCRFKADRAVAEMLRLIKANSSKWLNERPGQRHRFEWQAGYGAFTVSESQLPVVRQYVKGQAEHHRTRSFQEEFLEFLKRHGITFDERYIWR
jgi:REP element-mobilizing transposase RayT